PIAGPARGPPRGRAPDGVVRADSGLPAGHRPRPRRLRYRYRGPHATAGERTRGCGDRPRLRPAPRRAQGFAAAWHRARPQVAKAGARRGLQGSGRDRRSRRRRRVEPACRERPGAGRQDSGGPRPPPAGQAGGREVKLSERFDRRYQQAPAPVATPAAPAAEPTTPPDGSPTIAPVERRAVARESAPNQVVTADPRT